MKAHKVLLLSRHFRFLIISATLITFILITYCIVRDIHVSYQTTPRKGFLVDTPGCQIPDVNPFDQSIRHLFIKTDILQCDKVPPVTYVDGEWLRINKTALKVHFEKGIDYCEYEAILRSDASSPNPDNNVIYNKTAVNFTSDIKMTTPFIRIACYGTERNMIYRNFHALVLKNNILEQKLDILFNQFMKRDQPKETMNVIVLGVASVSRLNFIRHMPKTRRFLVETLKAFELKGYNKVADNTFPNMVPMLTGKYAKELGFNETTHNQFFDKYPLVWKNFSFNGYRTMFAEDAPHIAMFNYLKKGFHHEPVNYYLRPFSLALEKHGSVWNQGHDCVGSKPETQIVLDYLKEFVSKFNNKPYFAVTFISRLTHDYLNKAGLGDILYLSFFQWLHKTHYLNNTAVIFFSDHGIRFGPIRNTYIGKLEERLPFAYLILPHWFQEKYPDIWYNLQLNQNRLTTPFDIFETLKDIRLFKGLSPPASLLNRGLSLFSEIPKGRTCDHARVLPHWCTCHKKEPVSLKGKSVIQAAKSVVTTINSQLHNQGSTPCAILRLSGVTDALKLQSNDQVLFFKNSQHDVIGRTVIYGEKPKRMIDYLITLHATPGDGLFEATVRHSIEDDHYQVIGDISRINRYGNQSVCINSASLKKFCYCL